MEKELSLLEVYNWAIRLKDWTEFKSAIDEFYNGTPRSAKDESTYKLVKNNGVLDDVSNCTNFSNRKFIRPYFDGISTGVTQYQVVDELGQFWFQGTKEECEQYLYGC